MYKTNISESFFPKSLYIYIYRIVYIYISTISIMNTLNLLSFRCTYALHTYIIYIYF